MCANIWDQSDQDVYSISTLTYVVMRTVVSDHDCGNMKVAHDYLKWILSDPMANAIASSQGFGTMPKKVAELAITSILDSMQCRNSASFLDEFRFLKDEQIPVQGLSVRGSVSSLQEGLQAALIQVYSGAGKSTITYNGALGSGGGQGELTVGNQSCWFNATSKETVARLQYTIDPITKAQVCSVPALHPAPLRPSPDQTPSSSCAASRWPGKPSA